ncbi:MAG: hypothetical protein K2N41_03900 [Lachnospiraceae bacterium]|nr:hypothetical protein [Lachnospiraceae bacterium]
MANKKKNYIFTDKKTPPRSVMYSILGVISLSAIAIVTTLTFQTQGNAKSQYGASLFLSMIFSFIGILLGVLAKAEKDKFYFFCYLGIFLNLLALCAISFILYAGAYGL